MILGAAPGAEAHPISFTAQGLPDREIRSFNNFLGGGGVLPHRLEVKPPIKKTTVAGIRRLDPQEYPHEYYRITVVAKGTGLTATHLRQCHLRKYRFGNTDYLRTTAVNDYIADPAPVAADHDHS